MALRIGDLVGFIRADDSGMRRGLSEAEMRLAGFQRDANGRLRDLHGHFISESDAIGRAIAAGLGDGSDEGVRQLRTRLRAGIRQAGDDTDRGLSRIWRRLVTRSGQSGDDSGRGFGRRLLSTITSTLQQGIGAAFNAGMSGLRSASSSISSNPYVGGIGLALAAAVVATALPLIGALLSGAVIAVGGLSIIGLGAVLLKNEPEVKSAAKRLMDTVKGEFTKAAQPLKKPLVDAINAVGKTAKDVAPQINEAFKTVADSGALKSLTDGFDDLVKNALPGFNKSLKETGPVFEGIKQLLGDVGTGISEFFEGISQGGPGAKLAFEDLGTAIKYTFIVLGQTIGWLGRAYGAVRGFVSDVIGFFQHLYDVLVGHSIVPDMVNAIIMWIAGLPERAASALGGLGGKIVGVASKAMSSLGSSISRGISTAVSYLAGLPGRAASAASSLGSRISSVASRAMSSLGSAISRGVSTAISYVRGLPGRASSALGGLGSRLYGSGRSLIGGFVSGILSKIGEVRSAASRVLSAARDYFPFSPAKRGPFSGSGYTSYSGAALMDGFMGGILSRFPQLRSTLGGLPGVDVPGMAGGLAGAGAAGQAGRTLTLTGGDAFGRFMVQELRRQIGGSGGNVQFVLGRG
ncbi:phage tail protein [Streptomyces sp. NPDC002547]